MSFWKFFVSAVFAVTLLGCANKYHQPRDVTTQVSGVTKAQVRSAILASDIDGWSFKTKNDSNITGNLYNRGYEVTINIKYSASEYTIQYISASNNLKNKNGEVHRNYNRWINNLNAEIKQRIYYSR